MLHRKVIDTSQGIKVIILPSGSLERGDSLVVTRALKWNFLVLCVEYW